MVAARIGYADRKAADSMKVHLLHGTSKIVTILKLSISVGFKWEICRFAAGSKAGDTL